LFTIIVLGESVSAATVAVQSAADEHGAFGSLAPAAAGGLLLVFAAWWIYFAVPIEEHLVSSRVAFAWGYGHFAVYTSAAAIGAGLEIAVEQGAGDIDVSTRGAAAAVALPAAVFLFAVWLLHSRRHKRGLAQQTVLPGAALVVAACSFTGAHAVLWVGIVCASAVAVSSFLEVRSRGARSGG
jgi:low temperature requirement protein LtrA